MAIIRGPDGKPIDSTVADDEATTRRIERRDRREPTPAAPPAEETQAVSPRRQPKDETATRVIGGGTGRSRTEPAHDSGGEPQTRIFGGGGRAKPAGEGEARRSEEASPMDDPVVGWLVVVKGPGKGASRQLGYGMNGIGRAATERVCIDFGDEEISRTQHAIVTYDPKGNKFYVQHGGGKNLTYDAASNEPILSPKPLAAGDDILIGQTILRFVPFCSEDFSWTEQ